MIALLLFTPSAPDIQCVTELLECVQRPAYVRIVRCRILFEGFGTLLFDGPWMGEVYDCHLDPAIDGGEFILKAVPGVELVAHDTTVTVRELAAAVERQRRTLQGAV